MWPETMWPKEDRVRHYFAATHRRAEYLQHITVQKIGSDPTLGEIVQILDARRGLHKDYISMEDELDEFINYDTIFIDEPRFYTELTILARKTGGAVSEALSMSTEYLSNIGDVDDIYQESMMSCIEWSSQIATITAPGISIPRRKMPTMRLLNARINLKRTLTRMEAHWKKLQEEVKSRDDEIVFLELQELVETARHTTDNLPPYWNKGVTIPISSDDYSTFESGSEPDDPPTARTNNEPCTHTGSGETERENYDNTITGPNRRTNDISARQAQNRNPDMPGPRLDEDESRNLRHIAETFENIRSDLVTAWNRAMIWVDDEVVFAKLNALLTVTKEATDRVIEATLRAEREANDEPGNAQANANKFSHNNTRDRQETAPVTTERLHATQNHPQPLPTRDGHFTPARRVYIKKDNPQPDERRAVLRQAEREQPVVIKRIEAQLPPSAEDQNSPHHHEPEELIPSPTMPPLEDPDEWHEYGEFNETNAFFPIEILARITRTLPHFNQCTAAPLSAADSTRSVESQQETDSVGTQRENQNSGSPPPAVNTNGHTNTTQQDTEMDNPMAGSQLRSKLRNLAAKRRRAHDNNNETHTQTDQDTADNVRKRPHNTSPGANPTSKLLKEEISAKPAQSDKPSEEHPAEKRQQSANNNIDRHNYEQDRPNQSTPCQGTPGENDHPITSTTPTPTEGEVIKRPKRHRKTPWSPTGDLITIYESEDEVKLEESPIGAHTPHRRRISDRNCESTPTVRRKLALDDQTPNNGGMTPVGRPLPSISASRPPPLPDRMYVGQPQREIRSVAYADDRIRPQYDYLDITTSDSENSQRPDQDSSDDDGHRDCGLPGGYERCPDNPANYQNTRHSEGDFDKDHSDTSDRGIT